MRKANFIFNHPGLSPLARYIWITLYRQSGCMEEDRGSGRFQGYNGDGGPKDFRGYSRTQLARVYEIPQKDAKAAVDQLHAEGLIITHPTKRGKLTVVQADGRMYERVEAHPLIGWWRDTIGIDKAVTAAYVAHHLVQHREKAVALGLDPDDWWGTTAQLRWLIEALWYGKFVHGDEVLSLSHTKGGWTLCRWATTAS